MQYRDEFDGPDIKGAVASIFGNMKRRESISSRGPVWAGAVVLSLVVFLLSVLWYSYPKEAETREVLNVPIIRADAGPYKVIPSDPGGMDIPHRDSTVFETLRADRDIDSDGRHVENLLGEPEEPISREQLFAGLKTQLKVEGREVISAREEPPVEAVDISEEISTTIATAEPVPAKEPEPIKVASAKPVPVAKPEREIAKEMSRTEPAAGKETFEKTSLKPSERHYVQLASLSSEAAAEGAWKDLQKSMAFLKPHGHRVERADLGAKGVYYRLQAGPFTAAQAQEVCNSVKAQKPGGCLVIKP